MSTSSRDKNDWREDAAQDAYLFRTADRARTLNDHYSSCTRAYVKAAYDPQRTVRERTHYCWTAAGSDSNQLANLFRGHPAWGTMIAPGPPKGLFRLAGPAATPIPEPPPAA